MPQSMGSAGEGDQRRDERVEVFLRTSLATERKSGISAQLVNISSTGFMIRSTTSFAPEDRITILLPAIGAIAAQVVWAQGGRIGCAFVTPFDEAGFTALLDAIKSAKPNWHIRI